MLNVWRLSVKLSGYSFISADGDDGSYNSFYDDFDEEEDDDDDEEEDEESSRRKRRRRRGKWLDQFCVMGNVLVKKVLLYARAWDILWRKGDCETFGLHTNRFYIDIWNFFNFKFPACSFSILNLT